jgi:hypothetical protein
MWKHALESAAGPDSGQFRSLDQRARPNLWRYAADVALLLGLLLASSWLSSRW